MSNELRLWSPEWYIWKGKKKKKLKKIQQKLIEYAIIPLS